MVEESEHHLHAVATRHPEDALVPLQRRHVLDPALSRVRLVQPAVRHQPAPVNAHPVDLHTEAGGKADVRLRLAPRAQPLLGPRHVGPRSHVALASKPEPSVVQAVLLVRRSGRYAPPEAVRVVPEVRDGGVR